MTLLSALFDGREEPVYMVSSYDKTITYVNEGGARLVGQRPGKMVGAEVEDFMPQVHEYGLEDSPLLLCLRSRSHATEHTQHAPGVWWVASMVPCADPVDPEIFATEHRVDTLERALAEHSVLVVRAAAAMEYGRILRLLNAATAATTEAMRRMDYIGDLIAERLPRPLS